MSESAERVQAGEKYSGAPCGYCHAPLFTEDMAAVCAECQTLHHEACWDRELGCSKAGCMNAPLKRLDADVGPKITDPFAAPAQRKSGGGGGRKPSKKAAPPGMKACVGCSLFINEFDEVCEDCFTINTEDGLYHGPKRRPDGLGEAFAMGLVSLIFCGPILGPMAISRANAALDKIKRDPRLEGQGMAIAAMIFGGLGLLLWVVGLVAQVGGVKP